MSFLNFLLTSPIAMMIIVLSIFVIPLWRIVRRTGHSGWWSLLTFVPVGNLIGLWVLAFSRWPAIDTTEDGLTPPLPGESDTGAGTEKKTIKTILIWGTVGALLGGVFLIDQATRPTASHSAKTSNGVDIAKMAPDFTLKDLNGKDVSLAQYRGKVVLINFWATWCDPCRVEIPWLIEMQEKYGPRGFVVLGIAMDEEGRKAVEPYVQKERFTVNGNSDRAMNYPILIGNDAVADKFGGLIGFPTSVLISKDGREVKRITGLISYDEIAKAIESLL